MRSREWAPGGRSTWEEEVMMRLPSAPLAWRRGAFQLGETAANTRPCSKLPHEAWH